MNFALGWTLSTPACAALRIGTLRRPDSRSHEFENHTPRPFLFEFSTDSKIDLVADLESVDVNPIFGQVWLTSGSVYAATAANFFSECQFLPNSRPWLFDKVRPIVTQKDD